MMMIKKPRISNIRVFSTTPTTTSLFTVGIEYFGRDSESDICRVKVEVAARSKFKSATEAVGHALTEGKKNLQFIPLPGQKHIFVWDVNADNLSALKNVKIRIRATDGTKLGPWKKILVDNLTLI